LAVLRKPHPVHTTQDPSPSASTRAPRVLTRGPSTRAMAHCTLISRLIQKHDDRLGGQACSKQHASPTRLWDKAHPIVSRSHHSLRCHLDPARDDAGCHGASSWGRTRAKAPVLCSIFCLPEGRVCELCRPSPHCGVGCGALYLDGCFRVFWPETADPSRAALAPSPNATLRVANDFSNKCQVEG
jgi:hypothetical protein